MAPWLWWPWSPGLSSGSGPANCVTLPGRWLNRVGVQVSFLENGKDDNGPGLTDLLGALAGEV